MACETEDVGNTSRWHFTYIPKKKLAALEDKVVKPFLKKWGLSGRIQSQTFAYNGSVEEFQIKDLLKEFFRSSDVYPHLKADPHHTISQLLTKVSLQKVPCTLTNLQIFERLTDPTNGIVFGVPVQEMGDRNEVALGRCQLRQCIQREVDGFLVADELRKILLEPSDEDLQELYSPCEKDEFLFCLFKHICLGGLCCQYEDSLEPYLTVTKLLYKHLISVVKSSTAQLVVCSRVFKVEAGPDDCDVASFPRHSDRENNFAYVMIHLDKKYVTTFVHQAGWSDEK